MLLRRKRFVAAWMTPIEPCLRRILLNINELERRGSDTRCRECDDGGEMTMTLKRIGLQRCKLYLHARRDGAIRAESAVRDSDVSAIVSEARSSVPQQCAYDIEDEQEQCDDIEHARDDIGHEVES